MGAEMGRRGKTFVIAVACISGPLLASAASSMYDDSDSGSGGSEDFDLGSTFVSPDSTGSTTSSSSEPNIIVTAGYRYGHYSSYGWGWGYYGGGGGGGGSSSDPRMYEYQPGVDEPPCEKANPITQITAPDGARYFVPKNVDSQYLVGALNHLTSYAQAHGPAAIVFEFKRMYSVPTHPFFIDFKDWGTSAGPPGSIGAPTISYYSQAAGGQITTTPFEAFGNFFFGYAGSFAGISPEVLHLAAAAYQEGDTGWIPADAPEDREHVDAGIAAARRFAARSALGYPETSFGVGDRNCTDGNVTEAEIGTSNGFLVGSQNPLRWENDSAWRSGLWSGFEQSSGPQ